MVFTLVMLTVIIVIWLWVQLCEWFFGKLKPAFERWLWHKLGGSGKPPTMRP